MVHTLQPTQVFSSTSLAPVLRSRTMASTGQAWRHQASSHWVQVYGTLRPSFSKEKILIRDLPVLKVLWCCQAQAISHWRHPVHLFGSSFSDLCICDAPTGRKTGFDWSTEILALCC